MLGSVFCYPMKNKNKKCQLFRYKPEIVLKYFKIFFSPSKFYYCILSTIQLNPSKLHIWSNIFTLLLLNGNDLLVINECLVEWIA